jgi:hypothetical protein
MPMPMPQTMAWWKYRGRLSVGVEEEGEKKKNRSGDDSGDDVC